MTFTVIQSSKSQTNNTAAAAFDTKDFIGNIAVVCNMGAITAGDAGGTLSVRLVSSADTNVSNGTNVGVNTTNVSASASLQVLTAEKRGISRYLFAVPTVVGVNSPAFPFGVVAAGVQQVQG